VYVARGAAAGSEGEEEVEDPEDLAACLLRLHREHQRLEDLVAAQCKGGRGKKGEGLTQVRGVCCITGSHACCAAGLAVLVPKKLRSLISECVF
jgi:hypothetical protein